MTSEVLKDNISTKIDLSVEMFRESGESQNTKALEDLNKQADTLKEKLKTSITDTFTEDGVISDDEWGEIYNLLPPDLLKYFKIQKPQDLINFILPEQQAIETQINISNEVQSVLDELGIQISPDWIKFPSGKKDGFRFPGQAPPKNITGELRNNTIFIKIELGNEYSGMFLAYEINLENRTHQSFWGTENNLTPVGNVISLDSIKTYEIPELITVSNWEFVPNIEGVYRHEYSFTDFPIITEMFDWTGIDFSKKRPYFVTELNSPGVGVTLAGVSIINIKKVEALARERNNSYDTVLMATRANEASNSAFFQIMQRLPIAEGMSAVEHVLNFINANYFENFNTGSPEIQINNNNQVNEFISDAVSVQYDSKEIFRILEYSKNFDYFPQYEFSARFIKHEITQLLKSKGVTDTEINDFFSNMKNEKVQSTDIVSVFNISESELNIIQASYKKMGKRLMQHLIDHIPK